MKQIFSWINLDGLFTSFKVPYCVWESKKNPSSNAALGKIREHSSAHGVNIIIRYMENVTSIISQGKYSMLNVKNSGDTSHQFIFSDFNHRFFEKLIFQMSLWKITCGNIIFENNCSLHSNKNSGHFSHQA